MSLFGALDDGEATGGDDGDHKRRTAHCGNGAGGGDDHAVLSGALTGKIKSIF